MGDQTLYNTMTPSAGSVTLAHERIIRLKLSGVFVNMTADINNLALNPTPITVPRERYGNKGKTAEDVIGYNFAPSFDVEVVRDPATKQIVAAQAWVLDLMKAAYATGELNKRTLQIITDAFDERFPAFEGKFSVTVAEGATGYADKGVLRFTLKNDGDTAILATSPIAGTGVPVIETVTPPAQGAGDLVVVRGYGLGTAVSATVKAVAATEIRVVDPNQLVIQLPTGTTAGAAPIIVTNDKGASAAFSYTAG